MLSYGLCRMPVDQPPASLQAPFQAPSVLPPNPSFAGHATFALRSGWLKKGFDALQAPPDAQDEQLAPGDEQMAPLTSEAGAEAGSVFTRPDALVRLGVGKNMVGAIRHWMLVMRIAHEEGAPGSSRRMHATSLGQSLFADAPLGWDPFLEDEATLWLLHWQLAGLQGAFTWAFAFSLFREWEFTRKALCEAVGQAAEGRVAKAVSTDTIERDVACLLQTYSSGEEERAGGAGGMGEDGLDCPLRQLGLLRPSHSGHFRFSIGAKPTLPRALFFYALARFWMWKHPQARALSAWEATYAEGSPGLVFKLDEDSVLSYLDGLSQATEGRLSFEDTAQVRQVVLAPGARLRPEEFLQSYYAPHIGSTVPIAPRELAR